MDQYCKIALIFPNFKRYQRFNLAPHQPPLSLGYLAGMLSKHKIPYEIIDAAVLNLSEKKLIEKIHSINPEYVGITTNISLAFSAVTEAKAIRKVFPNIKIIMGGPWAQVNYELLLKKNIADIVCFGEGEYTLVKILQTTSEDWPLIPNIAILKNNQIINNESQIFIENLDNLPFPDWSKFPIYKYDSIHRDLPFFPLMTIRGCPYDCVNCTKIIHGYKPRMRSIQNIIDELIYLKFRYNAKEIIITDDIFNIDLNRSKELLREIIRHKLNYLIQLSNGIRADHIDEEFALLLKKAGCYKVAIGIESASKGVIKFLKKQLDLNILRDIVHILKKNGLVVHGYFILGLPVETVNSMIYSIDFADKIDLDIANFFGVIIFPGTKLASFIHDKHYFVNEQNLQNINYRTSRLPFVSPSFSKKDYERAKRYYLIRFFLNPRRFLRFIKTMNIMELLYVLKRIFFFFPNLMLSFRR